MRDSKICFFLLMVNLLWSPVSEYVDLIVRRILCHRFTPPIDLVTPRSLKQTENSSLISYKFFFFFLTYARGECSDFILLVNLRWSPVSEYTEVIVWTILCQRHIICLWNTRWSREVPRLAVNIGVNGIRAITMNRRRWICLESRCITDGIHYIECVLRHASTIPPWECSVIK